MENLALVWMIEDLESEFIYLSILLAIAIEEGLVIHAAYLLMKIEEIEDTITILEILLAL